MPVVSLPVKATSRVEVFLGRINAHDSVGIYFVRTAIYIYIFMSIHKCLIDSNRFSRDTLRERLKAEVTKRVME